MLTPFERRRGLPIGNLMSQLFANVYLDRFEALACGARLGRSPDAGAASPVPVPADGAREESVDTSDEMAGFAGREERRPRPRTVRPAAFR